MNPSLLIAYQAGTALWGEVTANLLVKSRAALWPDLIRSQLYFQQILAAAQCPAGYALRSHFYLAEIGSLRYIWSMGRDRESCRTMEQIKTTTLQHYNTVLQATEHGPDRSLYRSSLWGRARLWFLHNVDPLVLEDVTRLLQFQSHPRFLLLRSRCFLRQGLLEPAVRDSLVALEWFARQLDPNNEDAARLARDLILVCGHLKLELLYGQSPLKVEHRGYPVLPELKGLQWFDALPFVMSQLGEVWHPYLPSVMGQDLLGYVLHVGAGSLQGSDGTVGGEQSG